MVVVNSENQIDPPICYLSEQAKNNLALKNLLIYDRIRTFRSQRFEHIDLRARLGWRPAASE